MDRVVLADRAHEDVVQSGPLGGEALDRDVQDVDLRIGDTLLVIGSWNAIRKLQSRNLVVINLPAEIDDVLPFQGKAPHAVFCLGLVIVLMVTQAVPISLR